MRSICLALSSLILKLMAEDGAGEKGKLTLIFGLR